MTGTQRRTNVKAGLILGVAAIFLIALLAISLSIGVGTTTANAATGFGERGSYVVINAGAGSGYANYQESDWKDIAPANRIITEPQHLAYVFFSGKATGTYTLGANFKILDNTWSNSAPTLKCTLDGAGYEIWNNAMVTSASSTTDYIGGLAGENKGTIKNLYYYFSGGIYAKKVASSNYLAVGGMIGWNSGTVQNCYVDIAGSIDTESDTEGKSSYVGGMIGYCTGGSVTGCPEIISSCQVSAYTDKDSGSSDAKHNIVYSGGVIGRLQGGAVRNNTIKSSATVISADNTDKWTGTVGGIIESVTGGAVDASTEYNDKEHIHPAGVIVGGIGGSGQITFNEVESSGSAISYGLAGSSNGGCIAGGFIGELASDTSGSAKIQANAVKLRCSISGFMIESFSIVNTVTDWFKKRNKTVYLGAVIGKSNASAIEIKNNYFAIEKDNGIIEDGANFDSDAGYDCELGLFCGNADGINRLGTNNWMSRKLAEADTGRVAGNEAYPDSNLHHLIIFGDGEVRVQGGKITSLEEMTVEAKPICSPFYGWTGDISSASPSFTKTRAKTLTNSLSKAYFVVFIDTEIASSGELTQLAKDINQIEAAVYKNIGTIPGESDTTDELMYFSGISAPTLSWLRVSLKDDILVKDGTPVIEEFYGKFDGKKHTISFASGSKIMHDFEKEADREDEDKNDSDDVMEFDELCTALFGEIKAGAEVKDLTILFGGSIDVTSGLDYRCIKDAGDLLAAKKTRLYASTDKRDSDPASIYNNHFDMAEFAFPDYDKNTNNDENYDYFSNYDEVYFYGLTGDGYVPGRSYNPGYIEVVPYRVDIIVDFSYVGILAGKNAGSVVNVEVEATKSAFVTGSANHVLFGTLCGSNTGLVENAKTTMNGKVNLHARTMGVFGGMFGEIQGNSAALYNGLNAYVGGEVKIEKALNFHVVTVYMFQHSAYVERENEGSEAQIPEGYDKIAGDQVLYNPGNNTGGSYRLADAVAVKDRMGTNTYRLYGADKTVISEMIGTFAGLYDASNVTIANTAAVSGAKGNFNTVIYNTDSASSDIGAMIGRISGNSSIPTFQNTWAVMSYEEFDKADDVRRLPVASLDSTVSTGINLVYVQKTVAIANVDINSTHPVAFTLASQEGMTFSGWYDYTSGERQVITEGLVGNVFTPQNQLMTNRIYVAELLNLQLFEESELRLLAASTNEGRGYEGVEFSLGTNIPLNNFIPIGTEEHPFLGTLDGNGLTITVNSNRPGDYAGLFGCVGSAGTVKNLEVLVAGDIGDASTKYAGAVAAINYGTIGQDTSTGKVVVRIGSKIKAKYVGGIVGVNHRFVKNAEVYFLYVSEYDYGQIEADSNESVSVYAGGAVGYNHYLSETTIAKNLIVYYDNTVANTPISSKKTAYAVGGVIGENGNGAAAYSLVSVFNYATIFGADFPGSSGKRSQYRGLIVGHNASKNNLDSLWALCLSKSKTSAVAYDPELGAPLSVYRGQEEDVSTGSAVLVNGEDYDIGNILIKYGWGDVSVSISGAESVKGGQITFFASKLSRLNGAGAETVPEEKRVSFYDYVASFERGDRVPVSEGNTGYTFSPTTGTADTTGLTGKTYYAGFCNTTIASEDDYLAVAANVQKSYRLYAEYNITNSFTLDERATISIGSAEHPFVGAINGNANTVTMYSDLSLSPFVGVLGEEGEAALASRIKNLRLEVRSGSYSKETTADKARGFLTDINRGTIANVNVTVHGYLSNAGSTGAVAGVNYGKIDSAVVALEYAKSFGQNGFGALVGKYVGGVVGENFGSLGNEMPGSIDVTISKTSGFSGVLYGTEAAGAVAGVNREDGSIRSAIVSFSGTIVGTVASSFVGVNEGVIESALVSVESGAVYAGAEAFGMIAGTNAGRIGYEEITSTDYTKVIKSYVYASPRYGAAIDVALGETPIVTIPATSTKAIGGIVGNNLAGGVANALIVELHSSLIGAENAGVVAGVNAGSIVSALLTTSEGADIIADTAGGIVGLNEGTVDRVVATLRGAVGSKAAGENGVVAASSAGGVVGRNTASGAAFTNVAVALYADVFGEEAGLAAGEGTVSCAENAWVEICNSSLTEVIGNPSPDPEQPLLTGFNVIRVLNETLLNINLVEKTGRFTFSSAISGVKKWYTDISAWTANSGFVSNLTGKLKYEADGLERDVVYYVCYDKLEIINKTDFNDLATKINSNSYYNNVLFRLGGDIMVAQGNVLRPIGTEEYPFNGIFDGAFYTVTLQTGSAISGPRYAGLFGVTAPNAVIENFVYTVETGVSIGSVNSYVIGSLVGKNEGVIKNVFVNLSTGLTYNSHKEYAGAIIGWQTDAAPQTENVWISVLNGKDAIVGNMTETSCFGVNHIGVLGNGMTEATFNGDLSELRSSYLAGNDVEVRVKYSIPTGKDGTASYQARCQAYFDAFDGWYKNIREENSLVKVSYLAGIGDFRSNYEDKDVSLVTESGAADAEITLSFIGLTITSEEDFVRFAENIKNYGDQGAVFKLGADIVVDFNECLSVGTPERPFTGTFDGMGHVITVTGKLIKREYAGVFGYVGTRGLIKNLLIEVGENVKFGDNDALYSGVAAALLYGSMQSVVVRVYADTVVYTTQGRASSGGIVGRAGKLNDDGSVAYSYSIDNCWLICMENATMTDTMGREEGGAYDAFYSSNGVGRRLQMVGAVSEEEVTFGTNPFDKGALKVKIDPTDGSILFNATDGGTDFYGFIDNTTTDEEKMVPISNKKNNIYLWTVFPGNIYKNEDHNDIPTSEDMLCVFINKYINTVEEFLAISENVKLGRNYRGISYELGADITISADDLENGVYAPIGGEVKVASGAGYESFIERDFIGGFYGNGHTITLEEDVLISARYAGLFGRVGADARIKDLILVAKCEIGKDNAENTVRTIYAGVLAAYSLGGESNYNNIVVVFEKSAKLFGSVGTGRAFGYLPQGVTNATNCWTISYNSKANYDENESELSYNRGGEGSNQGGFNSLMVIAAGIVTVNRDGTSYYFTYSDPNAEIDPEENPGSALKVNPYWYDRYRDEASGDYWHTSTDYHGAEWDAAFQDDGYHPTGTERRRIYNVSFLKSEISSYADLQKYATNVNEGYDFYKLTFTLEADIEIGEDFSPIGTEIYGMNGTFDGKKHTITLPQSVMIQGKYAGIFGYVSENGEIVNLRVCVAGKMGKSDYTQEQINAFHVENTLYAGVIAYNNGVLANVIVISEDAVIRTLEGGYSGLAIGYDATNLSENVWALVDASSFVPTIGVSVVGDTRVNTMKIIGIGGVDATFKTDSYQVEFTSDGVVPVMGWYKSFEKNQQISKAMLAGGDLKSGENGYLLSPIDCAGVNYEVAVIRTTITTVAEMIAVAEDVNIGGYSFENITFNLGANLSIPGEDTQKGYVSIGTKDNRFKGNFSGKNGENYYKITVASGYELYGVFGYNDGEISDLQVIVEGRIGKIFANEDNVYGAVACVNRGTIKRTYVEIASGGEINGYTVGGIVGNNGGVISDFLVIVREGGRIKAETSRRNAINAGAVAGINSGTIEGASDFAYWSDRNLLPSGTRISKEAEVAEANVFIFGTISARTTAASGSQEVTNAGGAVGNQYDGMIDYTIVYLADSGKVESYASDAGLTRAGGFVGYAKASMNHSVTFLYGNLVSADYLGGTAGYLDGVIALNVWQVTLNRIVDGAGEGAKTVNSLNIKGNGKIKAAIDLFTKRIIFTNVTETSGSKIDGWYTAASVEADEKTGNVGEGGNTFLPLATIQNKYVMVIFVNTKIYNAADLNDMASSVSGGLSGNTIVFTLMNDITIEKDALTSLIGTAEYPFNNVFDGMGYTITLKGSSLAGTEYVALFGYTGATSVIRNLTVRAEMGVYGSDDSERTALLVAYGEGRIEDVTLILDADAELRGAAVGSIVATNFGQIDRVTLTLAGRINAVSGNIADAGAVSATNEGVIENVVITTTDAFRLTAVGTTAYAGGLAGENYKTISAAEILFRGTLTAAGGMSSYAGVGVGVNLGNVSGIYVELDGAYFGPGVSGGLVGNNVNALTTSLVKIVGENAMAKDSVIGYTKSTDKSKVHNVWVYSDRIQNVSHANCVNSMIYEEHRPVSCPTAAEVKAGVIAFTADVTDLHRAVAYFALINEAGGFAPGTGAAMENVVYSEKDGRSYVTYLTYDEVAGENVSREIADVRAHFVTRTGIGSGSELYAFALAVNSGKYTFDGAEFSLTEDLTLPEIAFPGIALPSTASLDGAHHVVTVGKATLTDGGLFLSNAGKIERIGLRFDREGAAASFALSSSGILQNVVVYLEKGAYLASGDFFAAANTGTATGLWLVVKDDTALGQGAVAYAVIKLNGVGKLLQGGGDGLTFTAEQGEDILFIGYTKEIDAERKIFSVSTLFDTAEKENVIYSAEFISRILDTDYKLRVISDATALGYDGAGETFTLAANLKATSTLFTGGDFVGKIDGNGFAIKAEGVTGSLFGRFKGSVCALTIDVTEGDLAVFASTETVSLSDVVILTESDALTVGEAISATNVWVTTGNRTLYETFLTGAYPAYSLLFKNGSYAFTFGDGLTVSAADDEEKVFAGWYGTYGAVDGSVVREKTLRLTSFAGNAYLLNYINRTFASEDDLVRLATAVAGGFDFEGVTFRVADSGFAVSGKIPTIGDADHDFKGNILGGDRSVITFEAYGSGSTFEVSPFLYRLIGELKEVVFLYRDGAVFEGAATLVKENLGKMEGVVVISRNANTFASGAGLTLVNGGEINNSWFVTRGEEKAVLSGSLVGVNEMRVDTTILGVSFSTSPQGSRVIFTLTPETGSFLCLYDFNGSVVFPGNYTSGVYTSPATATGVKIKVAGVKEISDQDEFVYLGYATSERALAANSTIKLKTDVEIKRSLRAIRFNGMTLDLDGHYLYLSAATATGESVFGPDRDSALSSGTIQNGAVYLKKDAYALGVKGLTIKNCVFFLMDDGMTLPDYTLSGTVKVVTEDRTRILDLAPEYTYLYAPKAAYGFVSSPEEEAAILASFDKDDEYKIGFVGKENDLYYYGGIGIVGVIENAAYFASKNISSSTEFADFIVASSLSEDSFAGAVIRLSADVTISGASSSSLIFAGTFLGGGHTVSIEGGNFGAEFLTLIGSGSAADIAFAFKDATVTAERLIMIGEEENRIAVVVYQGASAVQVEDVTVLNVYGQGDIEVSFGEEILFKAKEMGSFALREWRDDEETSLGRAEEIVASGRMSAHFARRYLVSVEYIGVSEEILKKNQSDLPTFDEGIGVIFEDQVEGGQITVTVNKIGKGFLFKGLSSSDAEVNVGADAWTYVIGNLSEYEILLKADLTYIPMLWQSVEYNANDTEFTGYDALKTSLIGMGYSVEYRYSALDDTPPLVDAKPYHAGSYLVSFKVYRGEGEHKRIVCDASSGLIIRKAVLTFDSVAIKDKVYDGTSVAEKDGEVVLRGFKGEDAKYVTVDGLAFAFADQNVGQGKLVYVSGEGSLGYKAAAGATEKDKYVYLDYDFDAGSITSGGELIRANIRLRTLELTVSSKTVEYLDQFDVDNPIVLTPTVKSGLVEADRAAFERLSASLVTRERADVFDVGYYRILVGDSFAFPNYEVKLTPGSEAYYIVTPSEVIVEFDEDDTMTYGEKTHTPKYHTFVGTVDAGTPNEKVYRAMREGDRLYFSEVVYNGGNTMLPQDEKYSFTCLFSTENKNYTVKAASESDYRIVDGKALVVLKGTKTLKVVAKTITVTSDPSRNTKRFGKRTESLFAELAAGNTFVEKDAKLVVSREAGEAVGSYPLTYAVLGEDGTDLTSRYLFRTQSGEPYAFTITQVAILLKPIKTQIVYGEKIEMIKYGWSVEGGGITLADLYYATNWTKTAAPEKADAELSDLGVTVALDETLKGILNVGEYRASFVIDNTNANISEVRISGSQNMLIVGKRYLKLKINDAAKFYDGKKDVRSSAFGYTIDEENNLLSKDRKTVIIKENGYRIVGASASVGVYKIDGDFSLESKSGNVADNYYLTYVQGNFTIRAVEVGVTAEIGYFDEAGAFTPATINRSGSEYTDKIYYGDSKATFRYSLDKDLDFLEVPEEGTDKEISDYIASALKISHYRLNGLVPGYYEAKGDERQGTLSSGMIAANNNFQVTFTVGFDVEPVFLTVKLLPMTKTIGEPDPEIAYELIAKDPYDDFAVIEGYGELAKGTFEILIEADRSEGETLGSYELKNVKIEILNTAVGESLTDESSLSGKALSENVETKTEGATLEINQKSFLKTTIGKAVIYGVPLLVLAIVVVLLIIFIPKIRKKRALEDAEFHPDDPTGSGEAASEPGADQASTEGAAEQPASTVGGDSDGQGGDSDGGSVGTSASSAAPSSAPSSADDMFFSEPPVAGQEEGSADFDPAEFDIGPRDDA